VTTIQAPPAIAQRCERIASIPGPIAITVGVVVLLGWLTGVEGPKNLIRGFATMKPNTAACFILLGLALHIKHKAQIASATRRHVANICAGIATFLGLGTTIEYAFELDLHLETLGIFEEQLEQDAGDAMRMAAATA